MASKDLACVPDDESYPHEWKNCKAVGQDEFVLTKVVGLTNISKNALDCNQVTGYVGFPASCMLVLLDPKTNDQKFIKSPSGKSISCVSFSEDGRFVALGEGGVKPCVSMWLLKELKEQSRFVVDHCVGVKAMAIHPKLSYVVVIGMQDLNIGVWDYMRCQRLALTKWQTIPMSMTIPKSGSSVILCGHRKITLFNLEKICSNSYETNVFEDKKAVLLGRQSEYTFVDITSGKGRYDKSVYTVTTCGYLCEIRLGDILIDKACKVDTHAYCVRFALNHIFTGCCEGVVKICSPDTLNVSVTVSLDQLLGSEAFPQSASKLYLETTALAVSEKDSIVTCIYANCSIYSWRINNMANSIECSILLPSESNKRYQSEFDSHVTDSIYRESMFRSLMGCLEFNKYSRLFDSETLAARSGMRCHHDILHLMKGSSSKNQHVTTVRFSPDGRDVICGNDAGEIKVYDAATGVLRRVIEAHSAQVMCIELLYDNEYQLVCTGGRDRIIFILNAKADFSLVQVLCDHSAAITAISLISHDGLLTLVSAAADNLILVRRATPGNSLKFTVTGQIVESRCNKALNVTGDYIITGDKNGNIKLFKADPIFNPKLSKTLKSLPKGNQITSVPRPMCIDPTGSFIATAQHSGQIVIYHLHTGQPIAALSAQTDASSIKFTRCLRYIVSSTSNGCTMIWRMPERMTEFLISKRNKSYEVDKEVSYETTIVSCVKICKEMTVRESPHEVRRHEYMGPNSNHNYDTNATPGIESLNFLRTAHSGDADSDHISVCSTDSYLSCSTCRDSCSDTVHWCPSTDSSAMTNSATDRFCFANGDNMCGKIIEDSECRKLGPFRQPSDGALNQSFDKNDTPVLSFNSNSKTYETSGGDQTDRENHKHSTGCHIDDIDGIRMKEKDAKKKLRDFQTKMENTTISDKLLRKTTRDVIFDNNSLGETEKKIATITNEMKSINIRRVETTALFTDSGISSDRQENKMSSLTTAFNSATTNCPPQGQKPKQLHNKDHEEITINKEFFNYGSGINSDQGLQMNRKHLGMNSTSPRVIKRVGTGSSLISNGSYKTACSPQLTTSMDTSCSPGNSIFYSPSPCFSSEGEELVNRILSPNSRTEAEYKEFEKRCERVHLMRHCDEMSSTVTFVSNLSAIQSSIVTDPCHFNDLSSSNGILPSVSSSENRLDNISVRVDSETSQTNNNLHQAQGAHSKESSQKASLNVGAPSNAPTLFQNSRLLNVDLEVSDIIKSEMSCVRNEISYSKNDMFAIKSETSGIKNEMSSVKCEMSSIRNETSSVCSDKISKVELSLSDNKTDIKQVAQNKLFVNPEEAREKSNSEFVEEEEVYNYHSITRDESGKLRLVPSSKISLPTSPLSENITIKAPIKHDLDYFGPKQHSETYTRFNDSNVPNIQCSRCSHKEETSSNIQCSRCSHKEETSSNIQCSRCSHKEETSSNIQLNPDSAICNDNPSTNLSAQITYSTQSKKTKERDTKSSGKEGLHEQTPGDETTQQGFIKNISEQNLEEYFSELRQCLQLTNSQETVYKLVCDAQDQELMDLLELVLKKRSPPLMDKLNLPPSQRELYACNLMPSEDVELQNLRDMARDYASCKAQPPAQTTSLSTERSLNDKLASHPAMKISDVQGNEKCDTTERDTSSHCPINQSQEMDGLDQNTAKALINLVGRILTSRRAVHDHQVRAGNVAFVMEKSEVTKPLHADESSYNSMNSTMASMVSQQRSATESLTVSSHCPSMNQSVQQHALIVAHNKQDKARSQLAATKKKADERSEESDSLSDISLYKTRSNLSTCRYGHLYSNRTLDSGIESSVNEKLSSTTSNPGDKSDAAQEECNQCLSNWASFSPQKTSRAYLTFDKLPRTLRTELPCQQPPIGQDTTCIETTKVPEEAREMRQGQNKSSADEGKYPAPIVELFRDQDDYLKKLKEVREKFEMSIQALSKERKSRLAEEEKQQNK